MSFFQVLSILPMKMGCHWSPGIAILPHTSIAFDALLVQRVWLYLLCAFMLCSWRAAREWVNCFLSSCPQLCCAAVSFSSHVCCWTHSVGNASYSGLCWRAQFGHTVETSSQQYFLCFKRWLRKVFFRCPKISHWARHKRKSLYSSVFLKSWCILPFLSISKPQSGLRARMHLIAYWAGPPFDEGYKLLGWWWKFHFSHISQRFLDHQPALVVPLLPKISKNKSSLTLISIKKMTLFIQLDAWGDISPEITCMLTAEETPV